jgi:hypothetical protein
MTTNLVMVDESIRLGFAKDLEEAKVFVNEINDLIKNRAEVAKWLAHIITKHDIFNIKVLHPLHGQDYKARFNDQKSTRDIAFDRLLPVFIKNGILPYEVLKSCVITLSRQEHLGDKTLKQDWKRYLEKNKIAFDFLDGDNRLYFDYEFSGRNTTRVQKTTYVIKGSPSNTFDLSTVLKRAPSNMKLVKDSLEALDLLVFDDF